MFDMFLTSDLISIFYIIEENGVTLTFRLPYKTIS
jgi:hypothetical protein